MFFMSFLSFSERIKLKKKNEKEIIDITVTRINCNIPFGTKNNGRYPKQKEAKNAIKHLKTTFFKNLQTGNSKVLQLKNTDNANDNNEKNIKTR